MKQKYGKKYPDHKRFMGFSCYSGMETFKWLWHNVHLKKANPANVQDIPNNFKLNELEPESKVGFLGDIMDTGYKKVTFDNEVVDFFGDCDYIIGNFEATINRGKKEFFMDQMHSEDIIESLKQLKKPEKCFLSFANNHAGDFSDEIYNKSKIMLNNEGFKIFGTIEKPFIDAGDDLRIHTCTEWSNKLRGFDRVQGLYSMKNQSQHNRKFDALNILYPHWGYELELYPREGIVDRCRKYLEKFDAIIGHHSHVPQPVSFLDNKLVAFSLGDACFRDYTPIYKRYCFGQMLKITIGKIQEKWSIGEIRWNFIQSTIEDEDNVLVLPIENFTLR